MLKTISISSFVNLNSMKAFCRCRLEGHPKILVTHSVKMQIRMYECMFAYSSAATT